MNNYAAEDGGWSILEERIVIHSREDGQFAADRGIEDFAPSVPIGFTRHHIAYFRSLKVRQLPAEAFSKIRWRKMIGIISLRGDSCIGFTCCAVIMIHTDEDDLLKSHMECQL